MLKKVLLIPILVAAIALVSHQALAQNLVSIIPNPVSLRTNAGRFHLTPETSLFMSSASTELRFVGERFRERLQAVTGLPLHSIKKLPTGSSRSVIILRLNPNNRAIPKEGYQISVGRDSVRVLASAGAGMYYGIQTLVQLLPPEVRSKELAGGVDWSVPCVEIADSARFRWRGMHLDVGRHFFPKEFVKKYIDLLASYKLNTFHWHLTDDQGWRIEIKKHPALTDIGSKRTQTGGDGTPYGGYYTQQDIRDVVQYARERFVTVVPEIEMPGHCLAALAAYPELSCTGGPFKVGTDWGVFDDVYCAGNEKTFDFLEDVLTEVVKLFPGDVIHVGGDEVPKTRWNKCPKCQARMRSEGLANEAELQSYFIRRIERFLNAKGKRIIGWDEILEGGIAPNASVMSWRGTDGGIAAARAGHDAVMTPGGYCYFDHYQGKSGEPAAIGGYLPIDSVYAYEPVPAELSETEATHILGAQGNMWTEYITNEKQVEYMLMPRMLALSEILWEPKGRKDFSEFMRRVSVHFDRLAFRDVNFRVPPPEGLGIREFVYGDTVAELRPVPGTIRYTLDGTEPGPASQPYSGPVRVHSGEVLSAKTFLANGRSSNPVSTAFVLVDPVRDGLRYAYCEGAWDSLPDFSSLTPAATGIAYDVGLDALPHHEENYAVRLDGYLTIDSENAVTWYLTSDDGSALYIDGRLVVDNDHLHPAKTVPGKTALGAGKHSIRVDFFQKTGGAALELEMEGAGLPRQRIPARLISRE